MATRSGTRRCSLAGTRRFSLAERQRAGLAPLVLRRCKRILAAGLMAEMAQSKHPGARFLFLSCTRSCCVPTSSIRKTALLPNMMISSSPARIDDAKLSSVNVVGKRYHTERHGNNYKKQKLHSLLNLTHDVYWQQLQSKEERRTELLREPDVIKRNFDHDPRCLFHPQKNKCRS